MLLSFILIYQTLHQLVPETIKSNYMYMESKNNCKNKVMNHFSSQVNLSANAFMLIKGNFGGFFEWKMYIYMMCISVFVLNGILI